MIKQLDYLFSHLFSILRRKWIYNESKYIQKSIKDVSGKY